MSILPCNKLLYFIQVHHLEEALKAKEGAVEEIQKSYEDQLNKLTSLTKERELSWQKQKEEIEGHYQQLLNELQNRSKVGYSFLMNYKIDLK